VAAVNDLCRRLRPHARTLVDAFAISEQCLAALMLG
jgi:acyl-CoA oxidase